MKNIICLHKDAASNWQPHTFPLRILRSPCMPPCWSFSSFLYSLPENNFQFPAARDGIYYLSASNGYDSYALIQLSDGYLKKAGKIRILFL
ncbi:MAG: hypothetical protein ACTHMC_13490 [Pseudobacter sp.]|uniref:hypothetical protein n=1 Tax=Pseudobacter sp. TaxID=2045420 RepID=UPI003F7EFD28